MNPKPPKANLTLILALPAGPSASEEIKAKSVRRRATQFQRIITAIYNSPQACAS